ncbi:MAG: hypothetical protein QM811_17010 [Pirellulales bacterium]
MVTAFNLKQKEFNDWPGNDSFINAALLGRDPRVFESLVQYGFTDSQLNYYVRNAAARGNVAHDERDAYHNTKLRILTRDWHEDGLPDGSYTANQTPSPQSQVPRQLRLQTGPGMPPQPWEHELEDTDESPEAYLERTAAGWSDANPLADASRSALGEASGIKIPEVSFVVSMLLTYLGVLVVLNYGVFRLFGRVEYAWIAAPVIAIVGSLAVIKMAQTRYRLRAFANGNRRAGMLRRSPARTLDALHGSVLVPLDHVRIDVRRSRRGRVAVRRARRQSADRRADARRDESNRRNHQLAQGFKSSRIRTPCCIASRCSTWAARSSRPRSTITAKSASPTGRRSISPPSWRCKKSPTKIRCELTAARIGDLPAKGEAVAAWTRPGKTAESAFFDDAWKSYADQPDTATSGESATTIPLESVLRTLAAEKSLRVGDVRLIAIVPRQLPGMTVSPTAAQSDRSTTVVVSHVRTAGAWRHERDRNWRSGTLKSEQQQDERMRIEEDQEAVEQAKQPTTTPTTPPATKPPIVPAAP